MKRWGAMMKCRASSKLNNKQQGVIRQEVSAEFNRLIDRYNEDSATQVLHILHFDFGFGMKRLQRFADKLVEMQAQQKRRYELNDEDTPWLCDKQLKNDRIDVGKLLGLEEEDSNED